MIACLSCNGGTVTNGDGPATRMLVATLRGVHILERSAVDAPWRQTHNALADLHISCLLLEPRTGFVFAGAHGQGGLWMSRDGGRNWQPCMEGLDRKHVYTLAVQQRGDKTVLFAGTEPPAVYRSDDLGASWSEFPQLREVPGTETWMFPPPPHIAHVKNIASHPSEPKTLYVCIEQGALLKTVDDGQTWFEESGYASDKDFFRNDDHRVLIKPSDPKSLFMCGGEGMYASTDAGKNWEHLTTREDRIGYPDAMFLDPRDENVLYMAGPRFPPRKWGEHGMSDATVMRSRDNGHHWEEIREGLPAPVIGNIEAMGLYHWDDQAMLIAGTATGEVFACENAGAPWICIARGLPPVSKGGHYRWFLTPEQRAAIDRQAMQQHQSTGK